MTFPVNIDAYIDRYIDPQDASLNIELTHISISFTPLNFDRYIDFLIHTSYTQAIHTTAIIKCRYPVLHSNPCIHKFLDYTSLCTRLVSYRLLSHAERGARSLDSADLLALVLIQHSGEVLSARSPCKSAAETQRVSTVPSSAAPSPKRGRTQ